MKHQNILFIMLFFLILVVFLFQSYKVIHKIHFFKEHRAYFQQDMHINKIKTWMTLGYLERKDHIDLEKILSKKIYLWDMGKTLGEYCEKEQLNCNDVILLLEKSTHGYK